MIIECKRCGKELYTHHDVIVKGEYCSAECFINDMPEPSNTGSAILATLISIPVGIFMLAASIVVGLITWPFLAIISVMKEFKKPYQIDFEEFQEHFCPICGAKMYLKTTEGDLLLPQKTFWRCSKFPSCRSIINI